MKYVKAINSVCISHGIKSGDVREVLGEENIGTDVHTYTLLTYSGSSKLWARNFQLISCPCNVKNCLKHRISQS
jgi:hypothetical protein